MAKWSLAAVLLLVMAMLVTGATLRPDGAGGLRMPPQSPAATGDEEPLVTVPLANGQGEAVAGQVLVKLPTASLPATVQNFFTLQQLGTLGLRELSGPDPSGWYVMAYDTGEHPEAMSARALTVAGVLAAEPNYVITRTPLRQGSGASSKGEIDGPQLVPNDPFYPYQWHLAMIGMQNAWDLTLGTGVKVAVIDDGVSHSGDLPHTRIIGGWDYVGNDANADGWNCSSHGTHVAGTIAQSTNNAHGAAGVAPAAVIVPYRIFNCAGQAVTNGSANAVYAAAAAGVSVINMSFGAYVSSAALHDAVKYAHALGVVQALLQATMTTLSLAIPPPIQRS